MKVKVISDGTECAHGFEIGEIVTLVGEWDDNDTLQEFASDIGYNQSLDESDYIVVESDFKAQTVWYVIDTDLGWDSMVGIYDSEELAEQALKGRGRSSMMLSAPLETNKINWIES